MEIEQQKIDSTEGLKSLLNRSSGSSINKERYRLSDLFDDFLSCFIKFLLIKSEKELACVVLNICIFLAGFVWGVMFLFLHLFVGIGSIFFCIPPFCAVFVISLNLCTWFVFRKYQLLLNIFAFVMILLPIVEQIVMGGVVLSGGMFLWCVFGLVVSIGLESSISCLMYIFLVLGLVCCFLFDFVSSIGKKSFLDERKTSLYFVLSMFYMTLVGVGVIITVALTVFRIRVRKFKRDYRILVSSFPKPIIEELRRGKLTVFHKEKHVSIMFIDIVGFTQISLDIHENSRAIALVKMMNYLFRSLDKIAEKYPEVTKIKQLGDGVLYASGLFMNEVEFKKKRKKIGEKYRKHISKVDDDEKYNNYSVDEDFVHMRKGKFLVCERILCKNNQICSCEDFVDEEDGIGDCVLSLLQRFCSLKNARKGEKLTHIGLPCEQICDLAIEFLDYFRSLEGNPIQIRVGIHTGDVVCGVIGNPLFFDVFGHTVNVASRMESSSEPMKIQVSKNVVEELNRENKNGFRKFCLEDRGRTEIRGIGQVRTCWLGRGFTSEKSLNEFLEEKEDINTEEEELVEVVEEEDYHEYDTFQDSGPRVLSTRERKEKKIDHNEKLQIQEEPEDISVINQSVNNNARPEMKFLEKIVDIQDQNDEHPATEQYQSFEHPLEEEEEEQEQEEGEFHSTRNDYESKIEKFYRFKQKRSGDVRDKNGDEGDVIEILSSFGSESDL